MKEFTFIQLENFRRYEEVREEGLYNMFDPRARELTGLSEKDYIFVMNNYSDLKTADLADKND